MSKSVTVIVEGREYVVEVGDLSERPIKATVNQRTYHVQTSQPDTQPTGPTAPDVAPVPVKKQAASGIQATTDAAIIAPLPGDILEVKVKPGDKVRPGDVICVLEAMKMKNKIRANRTGVIESVEVSAGQAVDYGAILVTLK